MTDQNGPVYDPNPNTSYDEDFAIGDAAGTAGAAGAAGDAGLTPEMEKEKPAGGAPLRGLAMILTAVAVVLIAWGVYSFVGGDDDSDGDSETVAEEQEGSGDGADADGNGEGAAGAADGAAEGDSGDDANADAEGNSDDDANADAENGEGADGAEGDDGNTDSAGASDIDRGGTAVTVLNNGANNVGPIATDAADRLRDEDWSNIGYGNLGGRITGVSEESRVYYPEGNAEAQAAAEQIGRDLGIPAAAGNTDYYDRFGEADVRNGPDATNVVLVLTGPLGQ